MNAHKISANYEKGLAFSVKIDQYNFGIDTTSDESIGFGPSPKKLLLAGLAGCTGIDIVSILHKMQVDFSDFCVDVEAHLTDEHPTYYDKVEIIYTIKLRETDQSKMQRAVQLSMEKYCGVSAMFEKFAALKHSIKFLPH